MRQRWGSATAATSKKLGPSLRLVSRDRVIGRQTAAPDSDDSEKSSEGERASAGPRRATLAGRRAAEGLKKPMDEATTLPQFGALLEAVSLRSVSPRTEYVKIFNEFKAHFGRLAGQGTNEVVDGAVIGFMTSAT